MRRSRKTWRRRNLARSSPGSSPLLYSSRARRPAPTNGRTREPLQEGDVGDRRGPLRRGHRGAEEGVRQPSAPERPLQHRPRVRRRRATSRTPSPITRSTSRATPKDRDEVAQNRRPRSQARIRKQQAELIEAQQAALTPAGDGAAAGTGTGPGTGRRPAPAPDRRRDPARHVRGGGDHHGPRRRSPGPSRSCPGPAVPRRAGWRRKRCSRRPCHGVQVRAEPPRRAELHVDHHRAGHPPLGHRRRSPSCSAASPASTSWRPPARRRRSRCAASTSASPTRCSSSSTAAACTSTCSARRSGRRCRSASRTSSASRSCAGPGPRSTAPTRSTASSTSSRSRRATGGSGVDARATATSNTTHGTVWASGGTGSSRTASSAGYDYLPALEPRGPDGARRPAHSSRRPAGTSERTGASHQRRRHAAGRQGRHRRLVRRLRRRLGRDPRRSARSTTSSSPGSQTPTSPAYVQVEARRGPRVLERHRGPEHASTRRTSASRSCRRSRHERGRRRGPVHRQVRDRQADDRQHDLHVGLGVPPEAVDWTYRGTERDGEPRRLLRPRRGEDRRAASPSSATTAPTTCPTSTGSCSRRAGSVLFHPTQAVHDPRHRRPPRSVRRRSSSRTSACPGAAAGHGRGPRLEAAVARDNPALQAQARAGLHHGARVPELGQRLLHRRHRVLLQPRATTSSTRAEPRRSPSATSNDRQVPASLDPQTGSYPLFLGGFENQCQTYNVYGAELGVARVPARRPRRLRQLHADGRRSRATTGCSAAQLALIVTDARTSAYKVNAGVQLRTKVGIDAVVDFHYVSPETWAEQVSDLARSSSIVYQSFHLDSYELRQRQRRLPLPERTRPRSPASASTCSTISTASTRSARSSTAG